MNQPYQYRRAVAQEPVSIVDYGDEAPDAWGPQTFRYVVHDPNGVPMSADDVVRRLNLTSRAAHQMEIAEIQRQDVLHPEGIGYEPGTVKYYRYSMAVKIGTTVFGVSVDIPAEAYENRERPEQLVSDYLQGAFRRSIAQMFSEQFDRAFADVRYRGRTND